METGVIEDIVKKFFEKLSLDFSEIKVETQEENVFYIKVKTDDSGIIIGPRGKNLEAIKSLLKLLIHTKLGKNIKIHLEINDYLESKEERLLQMVKRKIELVEQTGKDIKLPFLSWYERKLVHSFVADYPNPLIYTKSLGEGRDRFLHICKKNDNVTIDLEGNDI